MTPRWTARGAGHEDHSLADLLALKLSFAYRFIKTLNPVVGQVHVIDEDQRLLAGREFGVGHGVVPEDELSCLLSSLSAVTEPSEVTPVTDTRDSADSSVSCDRTVIRWA